MLTWKRVLKGIEYSNLIYLQYCPQIAAGSVVTHLHGILLGGWECQHVEGLGKNESLSLAISFIADNDREALSKLILQLRNEISQFSVQGKDSAILKYKDEHVFELSHNYPSIYRMFHDIQLPQVMLHP